MESAIYFITNVQPLLKSNKHKKQFFTASLIHPILTTPPHRPKKHFIRPQRTVKALHQANPFSPFTVALYAEINIKSILNYKING